MSSRDPSSMRIVNHVRKMMAKIPQKSRRVRHKVRGSTYDVLGEAEVQISNPSPDLDLALDLAGRILQEGDTLTIYRGQDGKLWARFPDEFNDGRFEDIK